MYWIGRCACIKCQNFLTVRTVWLFFTLLYPYTDTPTHIILWSFWSWLFISHMLTFCDLSFLICYFFESIANNEWILCGCLYVIVFHVFLLISSLYKLIFYTFVLQTQTWRTDGEIRKVSKDRRGELRYRVQVSQQRKRTGMALILLFELSFSI